MKKKYRAVYLSDILNSNAEGWTVDISYRGDVIEKDGENREKPVYFEAEHRDFLKRLGRCRNFPAQNRISRNKSLSQRKNLVRRKVGLAPNQFSSCGITKIVDQSILVIRNSDTDTDKRRKDRNKSLYIRIREFVGKMFRCHIRHHLHKSIISLYTVLSVRSGIAAFTPAIHNLLRTDSTVIAEAK